MGVSWAVGIGAVLDQDHAGDHRSRSTETASHVEPKYAAREAGVMEGVVATPLQYPLEVLPTGHHWGCSHIKAAATMPADTLPKWGGRSIQPNFHSCERHQRNSCTGRRRSDGSSRAI